MPELPEVETVRRGLEPVLVGRRLVRVELRRADLRAPFPPRFAERLEGRRVLALGRRAKYLVGELDDASHLLVHLGMSGRFTIEAPAPSRPGRFRHAMPAARSGEGPHDHVVFETEDGARLVFTDHRRFGLMTLVEPGGLPRHPLLAGLGPEPMEEAFSGPYLAARLEGRRTPIKAALLDQGVVAGLGNIYVCEALFRARVSPKRLAMAVGAARAARLVEAVKEVLGEAIAAGGSSLRDYAHADGTLGLFQHAFRVYGREGEPCPTPKCGKPVRRLVQSGRSSFFCAACQR